MASIVLSVLVMCHDQLFCFALFFCRVCVGMVWTIWSVLGSINFHFSCSVVDFIYVFSPSSSGDVKGLLGIYVPQV